MIDNVQNIFSTGRYADEQSDKDAKLWRQRTRSLYSFANCQQKLKAEFKLQEWQSNFMALGSQNNKPFYKAQGHSMEPTNAFGLLYELLSLQGKTPKGSSRASTWVPHSRVLFGYMEGVSLLNFVGKNVVTENTWNCSFPANSKITLGVLRIITKVRLNNFNS